MNEDALKKVVETFFVCRKDELVEIFGEFLNALDAESSLSPGGPMSRNYDTAQANPEIHTLPGNLKDARDTVFPYFWGTDEWFSKLHLENVKGPANYASLVGALACLLKNPNLCVDTYSQRSNELEVKAITSLANLIFYHTDSPWGVFNMGGTISNLYGGRIGIEKVAPHSMEKGVRGGDLVGIVSEAAHYSNATLAGWLGLGTENLLHIPTDKNMAMRLDFLAEALEQAYAKKKKVAFVIATFGTTDAFGVDDISGIRKVIRDEAEKAGAPPPHLHVDAAVGWVLCFLNEYDLLRNPFELSAEVLAVVRQAQKLARALQEADSVTVDFHKMGWGHYPASAFIVNRRADLRFLTRNKADVPYFSEAEYRHDPALFTLECSRPAIGPYSVMASLNGIGLTGYQMLVAHSLEMAALARKVIDKFEYCKVLNPGSIGPSVVWWVLPKGRNAEEIYRRLAAGTLPEEERLRYWTEIRHLFDKRAADLERATDARLSFTTSIGFSPHGHSIPAWKAVFFNPRTDREVVERIGMSIENL